MVNDRIKCLSILYSEYFTLGTGTITTIWWDGEGSCSGPTYRQKTVQMILEDDDFDDDDYNRIIAMPFDQKQVPESIVQDRMKTIHILMKRYDLTPEEIREEELEHARKVHKQLEQLPFSGLVNYRLVLRTIESLEIIYNVQEYSEQQIRHLVLASPYAGSTFIQGYTYRSPRSFSIVADPEFATPFATEKAISVCTATGASTIATNSTSTATTTTSPNHLHLN